MSVCFEFHVHSRRKRLPTATTNSCGVPDHVTLAVSSLTQRPTNAGKPKTSPQPGRYRHYKGNEYTVIGTARHSETLEEHFVYRQEYGDHGLWVRPKQMFSETVKVDGPDVSRFQFVGGQS